MPREIYREKHSLASSPSCQFLFAKLNRTANLLKVKNAARATVTHDQNKVLQRCRLYHSVTFERGVFQNSPFYYILCTWCWLRQGIDLNRLVSWLNDWRDFSQGLQQCLHLHLLRGMSSACEKTKLVTKLPEHMICMSIQCKWEKIRRTPLKKRYLLVY